MIRRPDGGSRVAEIPRCHPSDHRGRTPLARWQRRRPPRPARPERVPPLRRSAAAALPVRSACRGSGAGPPPVFIGFGSMTRTTSGGPGKRGW